MAECPQWSKADAPTSRTGGRGSQPAPTHGCEKDAHRPCRGASLWMCSEDNLLAGRKFVMRTTD
jgi:hypothetical protein